MIEILLENKDFIILNKPAGLVVHPDGRTEEKTLCDFLIEKYPEMQGIGEPMKLQNGTIIDRPGIVHRLDRETSGAIVVARTASGFEYLKKLFQNHQIKKTYHAFVHGNIKQDTLRIDTPIGRSKNDFRQWFSANEFSESSKRNLRGELRDAVTEISVISRSADKLVTFIEARPITGRTHQIRVHLKSIYHPLLGDSLYSPNRENDYGFERTALHSRRIEFLAPDGENISAVAKYPSDFELAIKKLAQN